MHTTNVVVVTNFIKNGTSAPGGASCLATRQNASFLFFFGKSDILFYVYYFLTNMLDTIKA